MGNAPKIDTINARSKLAARGKPYWHQLETGIALGYRAGPGTWSVRAADGVGGNWTKALGAIADDVSTAADGVNVLDFKQAASRARRLARGKDDDADSTDASARPVTVSEALDDYEADLIARGANPANAKHPRGHLTPALLGRVVSTLSVKELKTWRNGLAKTMLASTVNRMCKGLKAALNQAAANDDRITNEKAWKLGLKGLPEADDTESNLVLTGEQMRVLIAAAYQIGEEFGLYVELHAVTGARSSQISLLNVDDLVTGKEPKLRMPSSLKGTNRTTRTRTPIPISQGLAQRLQVLAAGRNQPALLLNVNRQRWTAQEHRHLFEQVARATELAEGATIYALRHTAITRALLAGVPIRLVASSYDTSVAMIEKTYSKFIADHGDAQMRRAVFDADARLNRSASRLSRETAKNSEATSDR